MVTSLPILKKFEVPDLEQFDPAKAAELAKILIERDLPDLRTQVTSTLGWLESLNRQDPLTKEILETEIAKRQKEENALAAKEGRKAKILHPKDWLNSVLKDDFGPYRRTAWLATLLYHLNRPQTKSQAESWLAKGDLLVKDSQGVLTVFGQKYSTRAEAMLGESEIRELRQAITGLEVEAAREERLREQGADDALFKEGKLSIREFFEEKPGLFSVMPDGAISHRSIGGILVVKSTGKEIYPYKARGAFQADMAELAKTGKFLLLHQVTWETLSPSFFVGKAKLSQREAELLTEFWTLLKTGIYRKQKKERVQDIRSDLLAQSFLTPEEYFEGKPGICFLEKEGKWDWENRIPKQTYIYNLFFLVEREIIEGKPCTRLAGCPPWLKEFFADCGNTWWPEGEKFIGLPENLGKVLRNFYGSRGKKQLAQK